MAIMLRTLDTTASLTDQRTAIRQSRGARVPAHEPEHGSRRQQRSSSRTVSFRSSTSNRAWQRQTRKLPMSSRLD